MVNGHGDVGVPDMVTISDIDEHVINNNLKKRYSANKIYVSVDNKSHQTLLLDTCLAVAKYTIKGY